MTEIIKKEIITLPQVKEILESVKPDDMDQIQRWTYDYVRKFARTDPESAQAIKATLIRAKGWKEGRPSQRLDSPRALHRDGGRTSGSFVDDAESWPLLILSPLLLVLLRELHWAIPDWRAEYSIAISN